MISYIEIDERERERERERGRERSTFSQIESGQDQMKIYYLSIRATSPLDISANPLDG